MPSYRLTRRKLFKLGLMGSAPLVVHRWAVASESQVGPTLPEPLMEKGKVPGAVVAAIRAGKVSWISPWGVKRSGKGARIEPQTLFPAASLSKPIAALLALMLVKEGKLSLDTDINTQLLRWKLRYPAVFTNRAVTLRSILSHTSGLMPPGYPGYTLSETLPSIEAILRGSRPSKTRPVWLGQPVGKRYAYSSAGFVILQQMIEETTGKWFRDVATERILKPCGMKDSTWQQPLSSRRSDEAAWGHDLEGRPQSGGWRAYPELAASGLWTTAEDYAAFAAAWLKAIRHQQSPLPPLPCQQMAEVQRGGWGLGLSVWGSGERKRAGHDGRAAGYLSRLRLCPTSGHGAVILLNGEGGQATLDALTDWISRVEKW